MVNDDDAFVNEFVRMANLLPKNGLIVDVRGNGGGNILCAEKPAAGAHAAARSSRSLLSFFNSPLTLARSASENDFVSDWAPSIESVGGDGRSLLAGLLAPARSPTTTTRSALSGSGRC